MGIDQVDQIPDMTESSLPVLQKILADNADKTEGTLYLDHIPDTTEVPQGKKVIMDDGTNPIRIYWKSAKGNLGYIQLT